MTESVEHALQFGEPIPIKTEYGPVAFGLVMAGAIVNWSDGRANDLLLSRIWTGIYLYPTDQLHEDELNTPPKLVCKNKFVPTMGIPADWNRDGEDDLIVSDRHGFLYLFKRKGTYPDVMFEYAETVRDSRSGLLLNIPHDNPYHKSGDGGGYVDPLFYNYIYPMVYPNPYRSSIDLIVGDMYGNLWWLPDESGGDGKPRYAGTPYTKPWAESKAVYGKTYLEKYGTEYARPGEKICDENGAPFLLGEGLENSRHLQGYFTRPALYRNPQTGSDDLLVLAGYGLPKLIYLQRVTATDNGKPVFRNLGEVRIDGLEKSMFGLFSLHAKLIVDVSNGRNDLLLTAGTHILRLRNKQCGGIVPEYACIGPISGRNVVTSGYNYSEVLDDRRTGKRYLADSTWTHIEVREITNTADGVYLSPERKAVEDQDGVFRMEGETDAQESPESGFHQIAKWDFDGSGRQHLIAGSDKGLLYLLVDDGEAVRDGTFKFRSVGPLKDCDGNVIRIHNRVCPAAVDLNGDGLEDLVVGGATYQGGFHFDPNPGAGIYYMLNKGVGPDGLPILEPARNLPITGHELIATTNRMIEIQAVDLDNDGSKEVIIMSGADMQTARVYKTASPVGLHYTGKVVPGMALLKRVLDLDGDGELELVYAGGEPGVASYWKTIS
ncbi:VCBS repeat-containing protein [Paenibacillus hemerocallicola]|uniref:VCBS repeat-containing protein n=1 Tax=Paenibacillus hemerocallicola TaxID=1172614 RepID=A0A5C4T5N1_9BACL|nr:VCBS repeat-containing protein [Paenibacillus hemerocallicola]TNJ63990.1 VCBS repeat-containing protein [Paenibacillus hemerocallicola]